MITAHIPYQEIRFFSKLITDYLGEEEKVRSFYNNFPELFQFRKQIDEKEFYFSLSIVKNEFLKDEKPSNEISLKYEEDDGIYMQLISSGPNYEFPVIRDNYIKLIQEARKSVFIQTPYFVPDDLLLDTLKSAVLSGIDVKIMIPNKADHPFIYWVNQYYVGELLRLGANIYRYET